jgi:hypothetical protein
MRYLIKFEAFYRNRDLMIFVVCFVGGMYQWVPKTRRQN